MRGAGPAQRQPPELIDGALDGMMDMPLDMGPSEEERLGAFFEDVAAAGPISSVTLAAVQPGSGGYAVAPIRDWTPAELGDEARDWAGAVMAAATDDCESAGVLMRYQVSCELPGRATRRHYITLQAPNIDATGFGSEVGEAGLVSQAHRHVESIMRIGLGSAAASMRSILIQNAALSTQAQRAFDAQFQAAQAREALLDRSMQRDMEHRKAQKARDRDERRKTAVDALIGWGLMEGARRYGLHVPQQILSLLAGDKAGPLATIMAAQGTGGAPGNGGPLPVVDPATLRLCHDVTRAFLRQLAATEEPALATLLSRLPADAAQIVREVHSTVTARAEGSDPGRAGTDEERARLARFADLVCALVGGGLVDDLTLGALVGQLPEDDRSKVLQLREALHRMRAQAQAKSNGAPAASNGAPAANGAGGAGQ